VVESVLSKTFFIVLESGVGGNPVKCSRGGEHPVVMTPSEDKIRSIWMRKSIAGQYCA
jgi:hypothetical protein